MIQIFFRTAIVVFSFHIAVACAENDEWPPYRTEIVSLVEAHESKLIDLENLLHKLRLERVSHGAYSSTVIAAPIGGQAEGRNDANSEKIRRLLEELSIDTVGLASSAGVYFEPYYVNLYAGKQVFIQIIHGDSDEEIAACGQEIPTQSPGRCRLNISSDWWVKYRWY